MSGVLQGKVAVVTGGDTGIGKAITLAMAAQGAAVVIDYHGDVAPAKALVEQIESSGGKACAVAADVAKPQEVQRLIDTAVERYGGLHVMVNNAGIEEKHAFVEMPLDVYERIVSVNLTGVWLGSQCAAKQMIAQGQGGRIITISSVHEDVTMPENAAYCATKGAVRMLTRTIAVELASHGITANNVCPGAIETPMDAKIESEPPELRALLSEIPMGRMGKPSEVAQLCVFLASDDAAYITGASLMIDGGMSKNSGSL